MKYFSREANKSNLILSFLFHFSTSIGLQQCVSTKNGTAISNPVLHRDCRSLSGSNVSDNQGNGPGFAQNAPNSFGAPVSVFPNAGQGSPATLSGTAFRSSDIFPISVPPPNSAYSPKTIL